MRSRKALLNTVSSLFLQLLTIASGFIVPRMIIGTFGSSINGLTASISQFMGYLILLQSGVGGVVMASLYKPLANHDSNGISGILRATETFFRKIAYITVAYILVLAAVFPFIIKNSFDFIYTATLVLIIGIGSVMQYYFGITYQMLLQADQRNYLYSFIQMGNVVVTTIFVVVLVNLGAGIHIIKLASSLVFLLRPLALNIYVKRKYAINRNCQPDSKSIAQRWDGIGHTVSYFIHSKTDIFLLTIFSSLKEVSVYSVYAIVTVGLNTLVSSVASSVQAAFGNMIASEEYETLRRSFTAYLCFTHILTLTLFASAAVLIVPFISIYTRSFKDTEYIRPLFAYILLAAEGMFCLRQPYHSIIISAGHYKQTRNGAFIEALVNIILSNILIQFFGIIGVVTGTFVAMVYRTIDYVLYLKSNILYIGADVFAKRMLVSLLSLALILIATRNVLDFKMGNYLEWAGYALYTTLIAAAINISINLLFYRKDMLSMFVIFKGLFRFRRSRQHVNTPEEGTPQET